MCRRSRQRLDLGRQRGVLAEYLVHGHAVSRTSTAAVHFPVIRPVRAVTHPRTHTAARSAAVLRRRRQREDDDSQYKLPNLCVFHESYLLTISVSLNMSSLD